MSRFDQTLFQRSPVQILLYQWNQKKTDASLTAEVCPDQTITAYLVISPAEDHSAPKDFRQFWSNAAPQLSAVFRLYHEQSVIACRSSFLPADGNAYFAITEPSDLPSGFPASLNSGRESVVLATSVSLHVDFDQCESLVSLEVELALQMSGGGGGGSAAMNTRSTDRHEQAIRAIIDRNRHSEPKALTRTISLPVRLARPLAVDVSCHELDPFTSLLAITFQNEHSSLMLSVDEVALHFPHTCIDVDKTLDSTQVDEAAEAYSAVTEHDAMSSGAATASSSGACSPSVGTLFDTEMLTPFAAMRLRPGEAQRMVCKVSVKKDVIASLHVLKGFSPFGYFTSPLTLFWTAIPMIDGKDTLGTPRTSAFALRTSVHWSMSAKTLPTRDSNVLSDLLNNAYNLNSTSYLSGSVKNTNPLSILTVEIEGPQCVRVDQDFPLKLFLHNPSDLSFEEVRVYNPVVKSVDMTDTAVRSMDFIHPVLFREALVSVGTIPPRGNVVVEFAVRALVHGCVYFDSLWVEFSQSAQVTSPSNTERPYESTIRRNYFLLNPYQLLALPNDVKTA